MVLAGETARLEKEIGARIDAAVRADPRACGDIARMIGIKLDSLNKIRAGKSTKQYAKLALMAELLHKSPNQLLGFRGDREALIGALEGTFEGLGHDQDTVQELSGIVLKVIDTREAGPQAQRPRERARSIANFLVQQSVESQRR